MHAEIRDAAEPLRPGRARCRGLRRANRPSRSTRQCRPPRFSSAWRIPPPSTLRMRRARSPRTGAAPQRRSCPPDTRGPRSRPTNRVGMRGDTACAGLERERGIEDSRAVEVRAESVAMRQFGDRSHVRKTATASPPQRLCVFSIATSACGAKCGF